MSIGDFYGNFMSQVTDLNEFQMNMTSFIQSRLSIKKEKLTGIYKLDYNIVVVGRRNILHIFEEENEEV